MLVMNSRRGVAAAVLLASAFLVCGVASADEGAKQPTGNMKGTYMVFTSTGSQGVTPVVDPVVIELGGRQFLTGEIAGRTRDFIKENELAGRRVFIALESIVSKQEIPSAETQAEKQAEKQPGEEAKAAGQGEQASGQDKKSERQPLAERLIGTWMLEDSENVGDSGILSRLKVFTDTHWFITQSDPDTGVVIFHHGGRYELEGDQLTTHTDFAVESTAGMIGRSFTFTIEVDDENYIQTGVGNEFNEVWTRVK